MNIENLERLVKCHVDLVHSVMDFAGTNSAIAGRYINTNNSDTAVDALAKAIIDQCGVAA